MLLHKNSKNTVLMGNISTPAFLDVVSTPHGMLKSDYYSGTNASGYLWLFDMIRLRCLHKLLFGGIAPIIICGHIA